MLMFPENLADSTACPISRYSATDFSGGNDTEARLFF